MSDFFFDKYSSILMEAVGSAVAVLGHTKSTFLDTLGHLPVLLLPSTYLVM